MPIPKPNKGEKEKDFIGRCMTAIGDEYDDNDQALAICYDAWKNKGKKKREEGDDMKVEKRFFDMNDAEIRVVREEGKPTKIVGYFAKFGKLSSNLGGFREQIEKGFFKEALKSSDAVDLFNHDANYVLGRQSAGTLKIKEDDVGLRYECFPPDTQIIRELVLTPIERGDIKGNSFGFRVKGGGDVWEENADGAIIRTLLKGGCSELIDGSQVTFPAYPDTEVALRSMNNWKEEKDQAKLALEEQKRKDAEKEEKEKEEKERERVSNLKKKKLQLKEKEIVE